jgi:hypothetical protein
MKKLALLQLLLLPLAGLIENPKSADASAGVRIEQPSALEDAWHASEMGVKSLAKRLVGFSYAQTASHTAPHVR